MGGVIDAPERRRSTRKRRRTDASFSFGGARGGTLDNTAYARLESLFAPSLFSRPL